MIYNDDCRNILPNLEPNSVHLLLSDIPYNIHADKWDSIDSHTDVDYLDRISPAQVGKPGFRRRGKPLVGWSEADRNSGKEYQDWCYSWAKLCYPLLKPGGNVLIFGGRRTIHRAVIALEDIGFIMKDMLIWKKKQAHHRAQRVEIVFDRRGDQESVAKWKDWRLGNLAPIYEPIAWMFKKYPKTIVDNLVENGLGAFYPVQKDVIFEEWFEKGESGYHETQKPVKLMESLIKLTTQEGHTVLDPFMGSGSTIIAANNLNRKYIGIERNKEFYEERLCNLK